MCVCVKEEESLIFILPCMLSCSGSISCSSLDFKYPEYGLPSF